MSQDNSVDVGAKVFLGYLEPVVDEKLLDVIFSPYGALCTNPKIMRDPETGISRGYGFVTYDSFGSADAAIKAMNGQYLCNRQIIVAYAYEEDTKVERQPSESIDDYPTQCDDPQASQDRKCLDIVELFVGYLDPDVDEKILHDTFSAFGVIVTNPKIMRDPETGVSRGFGFISYDSCGSADAAIKAMNGKYLCCRKIIVSYAQKNINGDHHGNLAELADGSLEAEESAYDDLLEAEESGYDDPLEAEEEEETTDDDDDHFRKWEVEFRKTILRAKRYEQKSGQQEFQYEHAIKFISFDALFGTWIMISADRGKRKWNSCNQGWRFNNVTM